MFKRLLAGVMASLMATTGCASPKEKRSMEFAEKYMQKWKRKCRMHGMMENWI